jgi:hypothetical protein
VGSETTVQVTLINTNGTSYDYGDIRPVVVQFSVSRDGTEVGTFPATDPDANGIYDGVYEGAYTPNQSGTDVITVTVEEVGVIPETVIGTIQSQVAPLTGDLVVQVQISGPAAEFVDNLPVQLYDGSGNPPREVLTVSDGTTGTATFTGVPFDADYLVHLPKRDFDVYFETPSQSFFFDQNSGPRTFTGTSVALPGTVYVWRIGDPVSPGNGNAYEYTVGGRSWTAANNQVRDYFLTGGDGADAPGSLAIITSGGENEFIASLFFDDGTRVCPSDSNPKQCKLKGWIGLSDSEVESKFRWVDGTLLEAGDYDAWPGGSPPNDPNGNRDYVEINASEAWDIANGASTTNEGFFTEWTSIYPPLPSAPWVQGGSGG